MYKISKLKNGIRLIVAPVSGTKATTVLAMFPVGSRYETKKISGASHFVEHLMFKGTERRPTSEHISRELDALGAEFNAFTSKDYTGYYIKIDGDKQEIAYDMLSDMIFHSKFDANEIKKEKGVIVEELRMYEDNPIMAVEQKFDTILFGNHPLGWDIGGSSKSVKGISRQELWNYYRRAYQPKQMILVVAGRVDKNKILAIKRLFGKELNTKISGKRFLDNDFVKYYRPKKKLPLMQRVWTEKRKIDQAHIILGFPGFKHKSADRYSAALLFYILGGGMSSRLFVEVREKRGLAYMIRAGINYFRDCGSVYIKAGLNPARLSEALKIILQELKKIVDQPVTTKELTEAKTNFAGRLALSLEDSSFQANWYADRMLFQGKIETYEETLKKINSVTLKQINNLSKKLFQPEEMRLAVISPLEKNKILKMLN
ncbi:MAG: hypothetical protein COU29_02985 [Candidatus Magasanikbacteria bacterium CG10_big_fil_rev_8_21_14_0_10_36_32]|uniref:Peptidase M16 n=1 Tax=Candidatus Magasanikbacteria bacterium CG10_big_fil_rev_8_21_14_0_10_36_32 TaxID=1974646 RepID=A0A2M6W5Z7_9BACT|nr:MAG: hypothetical protein COU29_02985 [Candidatus Magasanikbacteria bacterium CG10_big_fil_rev_8_21_14_0_10_36_32]